MQILNPNTVRIHADKPWARPGVVVAVQGHQVWALLLQSVQLCYDLSSLPPLQSPGPQSPAFLPNRENIQRHR